MTMTDLEMLLNPEPITVDTTPAEAFRLFDERDAVRKRVIPDEQTALRLMFEGYQRLKELGWNHAMYCPKDGTVFRSISAGSTGISDATWYDGEWPDGKYWQAEAGDIWPASPILFKNLEAANHD